MQIPGLFKQFDDLQNIYGDNSLNAVYGAGCVKQPDLFLVFMNPTGKNPSSEKSWAGMRAPWIGTKNVWKMFFQLGFIEEELHDIIQGKKAIDWDPEFADMIYKQISRKSIYITNLSKATQVDARPLKNEVFHKYLALLKEEIEQVKPKTIITFGNQVSSVILDKSIKVSDYRRKFEYLGVGRAKLKCYPVFYPVGQGMRNMPKVVEDIFWIRKISKIDTI